MRIMGVDTALHCTGMGVIETAGQKVQAVEFGCIRNQAGRRLSDCLKNIFDQTVSWLDRTKPDEVAIEGVFFCRNVKTALSLGHARGAVVAACGGRSLPLHEYSPRRVKQAVCGFGGAGKEQITRMIVHLMALDRPPPADAADALAIAVCHWHASRGIQSSDSLL